MNKISIETTHTIALSMLQGIGPQQSKKLISYCGSAEQFFKERKSALTKIPGIGLKTIPSLNDKAIALSQAEKEVEFIIKNKINPIRYTDPEYPQLLKHCNDAPVLLFTKGKINFNSSPLISIVGTRNITATGKQNCETLITELAEHYTFQVVSGFAYGTDIFAHRTALKHQIPTIGVLGHGLDQIYPNLHAKEAKSCQANGGLVTEFPSGTNPDRENFPKRNRIVAGMSAATIVIESAIKGGSMITAYLANDYNRDVFAIPGRVGDKYSQGCNHLIKTQKAHLLESVKDLEYILGWKRNVAKSDKSIQKQLFVDLNSEEEIIVNELRKKPHSIDVLSAIVKVPVSKLSAQLLSLEFKGVLKTLPGKVYKLV